MAFEIASKAFEEAFGTPKQKGLITAEFLKALKSYLKDKDYDSAKAIYKWMDEGGKLSTFTCREDMISSMLIEFRQHATPYVLVKEKNGGMGFLIRSSDAELTKRFSQHVLRDKSEYCIRTDGKTASEAYMRSKEQDKVMIQVGGLTEEEALYLEEACNSSMPGEIIGIDRMQKDQTYLFTCHGKTAIEKKRKRKKSFKAAVAETVLVMNGETKQEMKQKAQQKLQYREAKAGGFPDNKGGHDEAVWIVGSTERFVKTTEDGFALCHAEIKKSNIKLVTDLQVDKNKENYNARLNAALSHVLDKECLYTEKEVYDHFRTKRSFMKGQALVGEQQLVMMADVIIANKTKYDNIMRGEGNWGDKLKHYQSEMSKLLTGVRDNKIPKGYTKEDILQLQKICKVFELDTKLLTPAIEKMKNLEVFTRSAEKLKTMTVEQLIDRFRHHSEERDSLPLPSHDQEHDEVERG